MGRMVEGVWHAQEDIPRHNKGRFVRRETAFHSWITPDGAPGPRGEGGFKAESGRYHLIIAHACPWAHRTYLFRHLKGLEDHITVDVVSPVYYENGWEFAGGDHTTPDTLFGSDYLYEVYKHAEDDYTGRVSVPVLWDRERAAIVNNESSEIIRMFNSGFGDLASGPDYYPQELRGKIDDINDKVYASINNGVYRSGFAKTQDAHEEAVKELFARLDELEELLGRQRYLVGDEITEADWRLFTTLIRFDAVYVQHFKCNIRRIVDYPNLWGFTRELYQMPGIAELVNIPETKKHYFMSHESINPLRIVPVGPEIDLTEPHGRG